MPVDILIAFLAIIASMKAEPMMPNMSVTLLATRVSTMASDGVIFCKPTVIVRLAWGT
jgi:hypothetical protein